MTNPFENRIPSLNGPATDLTPVIPSDVTGFTDVAVALFVETGGSVSFESVAGGSRTINVGDGAIIPVGVQRVNATGTTATGIHAFTVA